MKTKEEILANATNNHDRELMRKELDKFDRVESKSSNAMWVATFFTIIGVFGLTFSEWFILSFIPVFPLMIFSQLNMFKAMF